MTSMYIVEAKTRADVGRGASRRLRHADQMPAIIYGADKEPVSIVVSHNEMSKHLKHESFYSHILTMNIDGKKEQVVLKALQRHPVKPRLLHADFLRVKAGEALHMKVPLHFVGEELSPGVQAGGLMSHLITTLEVSCLPKDLPEFIEVDLSKLNLDETIHVLELKLPKGVKLVHADEEHNQALVSLHVPRVSKEDIEAEAHEAELAAEQHAESESSQGEVVVVEAPAAEPKAE